MYERIVIATRKTRLTELIERFNSRGQAKFYIEYSGGDFREVEEEHGVFEKALEDLRKQLADYEIKIQQIDRSLLPNFDFLKDDLIITFGQDGLVANAAKYVGQQPIIAINPDPTRIDGILLPFNMKDYSRAISECLAGKQKQREITLAEAVMNDGQRLLAFNDFFIGAKSHVSARYMLRHSGAEERQSSSGIIVSTGAGSTGWLSSVFNMTDAVTRFGGGSKGRSLKMPWESSSLVYVVREPFLSRQSEIQLSVGHVNKTQPLEIESLMPTEGFVFSDGVLADYLDFTSGKKILVRPADQKAQLVIKAI